MMTSTLTRNQAQQQLRGAITSGMSQAPDDFLDWHPGYAFYKEHLLDAWNTFKALVKEDHSQVAYMETQLMEALACFDRGEREPGRGICCRLYNILGHGPIR